MASPTTPTDLMEDILCPICKDPMRNPVSVNCGHNFCEDCIDQYFEKWSEVAKMLCPVCRVRIKKESLRPNWPLRSLVEKVILQSRSTEKGDLCVTHKEKLLVFCEEDKELMCWVCEKAAKHKSHSVIPVEEAAPEYKDTVRNYLKIARKKREEVLAYKADTEKESQGLLEKVKMERENTVRTFRQLYQVLEEQEKLLLAQMDEAMEEIKRERENHLDRLEKEHQSLETVIREMEEKLQQPAVDLLQDMESFMERCYARMYCPSSPITFPAALMWNIRDFSDINPFLEGVIKQFQDSLLSGLQLQEANIHFDPNTAHPNLTVSGDCESVQWTEVSQDVPYHPERFNKRRFVLGREEFTAGRHFWEVFVGSVGPWFVGVAKKSVPRKGKIKHSPAGGIWDMGLWIYEYQCYYNDSYCSLSLSEKPERIRVVLNCEGGRLAFYDADRQTLICEYLGAPFAKETLCPFFSLGEWCRLVLSYRARNTIGFGLG